MGVEPFLINPMPRRNRMRCNPLGEEVVILGLNPKHRRRETSMARRRRSRTRRNPFGLNPRKRRSRRNPVLSLGGVQSTVKKTIPIAITGGASIIASSIVPNLVRVTSPWMRRGVQAATAIAGGAVVSKAINKDHGLAWTISGAAVIMADLLQTYVIGRFMPGLMGGSVSGFGALAEGEYYENAEYGMGAFPLGGMSGMGAYPEESVSGYPY